MIVFVQHDCFNVIDLNGDHKMSFDYLNHDVSCNGTHIVYRRDYVWYKVYISNFYFKK